jgi:hypothetical protein
MAKQKKGAPGPAVSGSPRDLGAAIEVFKRGDYARARLLLAEKEADVALPEGAREQARDLIASTRIERGTLYVGLACIALFVLVVAVTAALQPH